MELNDALRSQIAQWLTSHGRKCPRCNADAGEQFEVTSFERIERMAHAESNEPIDTTPEWVHECTFRCRTCGFDKAILVLEDTSIPLNTH